MKMIFALYCSDEFDAAGQHFTRACAAWATIYIWMLNCFLQHGIDCKRLCKGKSLCWDIMAYSSLHFYFTYIVYCTLSDQNCFNLKLIDVLLFITPSFETDKICILNSKIRIKLNMENRIELVIDEWTGSLTVTERRPRASEADGGNRATPSRAETTVAAETKRGGRQVAPGRGTKHGTYTYMLIYIRARSKVKANFFFDLCRCSMQKMKWTNWILYEPIRSNFTFAFAFALL